MHPFPSIKSSLQLILFCFLGGVLLQGSSAKDYWNAGLKKHNEYRAAHNTPPLELDTELAQLADKCAQYYAGIRGIDHSCPDRKAAKAGENLSWSSDTSLDGVEAVKIATQRWYAEIKNYDFSGAKTKGGTVGHFTQVMWKDSKKLGMGFFKNGNGIYIVGVYLPAGNNGKNKQNVLLPSPVTAAPPRGAAGDSDDSSASIPSTLIRGQKGRGAISFTLVMSVAHRLWGWVVAGVIN